MNYDNDTTFFDMPPYYAGRTLYVYFGVFNNGDVAENARTWMYVDDVSLRVYPAP